MKTQLIHLISKVTLLSAMLLITLVASAQGQSLANGLKVNIPFDFTVGEKKLPAGEYSVGRAQRSDDIAISISDVEGRARTIRLTNATTTSHPKNRSSLIFHRYGDQYFLFEVWPAGGNVGRQFPVSKSERAQRELAKNSGVAQNMKCETVTIGAVLQ
jgi:hypothetical protein